VPAPYVVQGIQAVSSRPEDDFIKANPAPESETARIP